jgi:hypothetical protein
MPDAGSVAISPVPVAGEKARRCLFVRKGWFDAVAGRVEKRCADVWGGRIGAGLAVSRAPREAERERWATAERERTDVVREGSLGREGEEVRVGATWVWDFEELGGESWAVVL